MPSPGDRLRAWRDEPLKRVVLRSRALRPMRVRQFRAFGAASAVDRPAWVYGAHHIEVGAGSFLLQGAWLAVEAPAWERDEAVLRIGDGVWMRPNCAISASSSIVIEDNVVFGGMVTVVDSDHTWAAGHPNVLYNPVESAPIRIGRGTWVADRAAVLAGADIGERCIIGANSVVRGTIPDFSIAVGSPARVVGTTC
ncbi:MAG: transferase hexapeptide repeat containing protein [Acidimicrobiales bacterium]|nr:transferase hexapeptide repeat containing protein [Acidimicrobiales bacterium]